MKCSSLILAPSSLQSSPLDISSTQAVGHLAWDGIAMPDTFLNLDIIGFDVDFEGRCSWFEYVS